MTHTEPILRGKVKSVYDVPGEADKVTIVFHDKVTAWNGKAVEYPPEKGKVCCLISALLFEKLEKLGVKTHYLGTKGLDTLVCRKLTIVPVEVIVRNIAAGSIVKTTTLTEGTLIQPPIVEYFLKDDAKDDPLLTHDRVRLMGIDLVDFKLEFGYDVHGDLYLADEMSPDNMRLWKRGTKEQFDKDLFRKDEGDIV